ncbi:MAG: hypothetical protein AAF393_03065 [Pseudomonadota bacterium]
MILLRDKTVGCLGFFAAFFCLCATFSGQAHSQTLQRACVFTAVYKTNDARTERSLVNLQVIAARKGFRTRLQILGGRDYKGSVGKISQSEVVFFFDTSVSTHTMAFERQGQAYWTIRSKKKADQTLYLGTCKRKRKTS